MTVLPSKYKKEYTLEELATICICAKSGFTLEQTALVLQVPYDEFVLEYSNKDSSVRKSYDLGYLQSRLELNIKISAMAQNGSAAAQEAMRKIQAEQEMRNFMNTLDD